MGVAAAVVEVTVGMADSVKLEVLVVAEGSFLCWSAPDGIVLTLSLSPEGAEDFEGPCGALLITEAEEEEEEGCAILTSV